MSQIYPTYIFIYSTTRSNLNKYENLWFQPLSTNFLSENIPNTSKEYNLKLIIQHRIPKLSCLKWERHVKTLPSLPLFSFSYQMEARRIRFLTSLMYHSSCYTKELPIMKTNNNDDKYHNKHNTMKIKDQ